MTKYIIVLLIVCILALSSYIYRYNKTNIFNNFPYEKLSKLNDDMKDSLHLFLFFSIKNCPPCLDIIDVLNDLENNFQIIGIVPKQELLIEKDLRKITGAKFKLLSMVKFQRFIPKYAPTIVGVSGQKKILFVLPAVPYEKEYLRQFLTEFYRKAHPLLMGAVENY